MKKGIKYLFLLMGMLTMSSYTAHAQKVIIRQAQTRVIEPLQDVYVRPMVVDLNILKQEPIEFRSWEFDYKKLTDMKVSEIDDAKIHTAYLAAFNEGADVIVGATFLIQNHRDEKGNETDMGIDVIIRGYPAKYVNWHKMGEDSNDYQWVNFLMEGQRARNSNSNRKTEAVE